MLTFPHGPSSRPRRRAPRRSWLGSTGGRRAVQLSAERQRSFAASLLDRGRPVPSGLTGPDGAPSEKRFSVYRNNVVVGLIDALKANFPAATRIVGEEFFRTMARAFVTRHPPVSPILLDYGAEFPDFVTGFEQAATLPYLADVA